MPLKASTLFEGEWFSFFFGVFFSPDSQVA